MKQLLILVSILLILGIDPAAGQTNIISIRWGSTGDPLNGLTISWKSQGTADSIAWGNTPEMEQGSFLGLMNIYATGTQFDYTFPEQLPASTIYYSILDSKNGAWTEMKTYKTASDATDNQFSFSVIGDSRSNHDAWKSVADAVFDTDFTLFLGDIIADGADAPLWDVWFEYGDKFISRELVYHTLGNHDVDNSPSGSENFRNVYTLPGNELYYSFTYGNAVFICLDSQRPSDSQQYDWLLSTLEANNDKTWKIVYFHKPFYTGPSHTGEMDGYFNTWWKAFDDYGVDLIFNGHTHNYQRTKPINRNVSTTSPVENYGSGDGEGRCEIVAGSAGPLSGVADPSNWWLDNSASTRHFCNIDIDGDGLLFKVMDVNLVVLDSLVLNKSTAEVTFQVDLSEVTDLYDGGVVNVIFGARDSSFVMSDDDGDSIYTFSMRVPFETEIEYFFSYQTGADPGTDFKDEIVPAECGDAEGFRTLEVAHGNITLPPILFGSCVQASQDITFRVDMGDIDDLYNGGDVLLVFGAWDTSYVMNDTLGDSIYSVTVPVPAGTDLKYYFAYQNGADPKTNIVGETVPANCSDDEGYRFLQIPDGPLTLLDVMFGSCFEDKSGLPTIEVKIAYGGDDAEEVMTQVDPAQAAVGTMDLTSSDLEIPWDHEPQWIAMRFGNVQIPSGAIVTKAYVQFTVDEVDSYSAMPVTVKVMAEAAADAAQITTAPFAISSRTMTTATVDWSPGKSLAEGDRTDAEKTPDISAVIREVIAQPGWAAGNHLMVVIKGDPAQKANAGRTYESFDGSSEGAATLAVYFKEGTVGVNSSGEEYTGSIYPNPTEGLFYIKNPSEDVFSYEIYSINGKMVRGKYHISGSTTEVDISGLAKGIYTVKVSSAEKSTTHMLMLNEPKPEPNPNP